MNEKIQNAEDLATSPEEVALADDLAAFAKAFFVYPETNNRVRETRQKLLDGLEARFRDRQSFILEVRRDSLRVPSGRLEDRPLLVWLREALERTAVASLRFERGLTADSLHAFLERLRSNISTSSRAITFAARWPDTYVGLALGESRYLGGFHDEDVEESTGRGSIRNVLARSQSGTNRKRRSVKLSHSVRARLMDVERLIEKRARLGESDLAIDLVDEILAALPAAEDRDGQLTDRLIETVLEAMLPSLEALVIADVEADDDHIYSVIRELAGRFFRVHHRPKSETAAPSSSPTNRRRDGQITDDLDALLNEADALPVGPVDVRFGDATAQAEALRTCLFQLGKCEREHLASLVCAKVGSILAAPSPEALCVLDQYVQKLLQPGQNRLDLRHVQRVMEHFAAHGVLPLLRDCHAFGPEALIKSFPSGFLVFVDSLDESARQDARDALLQVCASVGDDRIRKAEPALTEPPGILRLDRVEKVLVAGCREVLPLARVIARHGDADGQLRALVAGYLRSLQLKIPAATVLNVLDPLSRIPASFLADVCTSVLDGQPDPKLRSYAGFLIRDYIDDLPDDRDQASRKAYAIVALQKFPGEDTVECVRRHSKGRGWFGLIKPPREIREAADLVLTRMRAK